MPIKICNVCQKRYFHQPYDTDFQHICDSGNLTLDQEDKDSRTKTWEDYTGSGSVSIGDIQNEARRNKLDGTRAAIEGNKVGLFTTRGNKAENTRQRQRINHIELK